MPVEALYLLKVFVTLVIFCVGAAIFVRYMKKKGHINNSDSVRILASLRLSSRDVFFVLKCGGYVLAIVISGNNGAHLMGRWTYDEWIKNNDENKEHEKI